MSIPEGRNLLKTHDDNKIISILRILTLKERFKLISGMGDKFKRDIMKSLTLGEKMEMVTSEDVTEMSKSSLTCYLTIEERNVIYKKQKI